MSQMEIVRVVFPLGKKKKKKAIFSFKLSELQKLVLKNIKAHASP